MAKKKKSKGRRPPTQPRGRPVAAKATEAAAPKPAAPGAAAPGGSRPAPPPPPSASPTSTTSPAVEKPEKRRSGAPRAHRPGTAPTRSQRLAAAQQARRRRRVRIRVALAAIAVLAAASVAAIVVAHNRSKNATAAKLTARSCTLDTRSDSDNGTGNNHVPDPVYTLNPPAGGNHLPSAAPPGKFTTGPAPADGNLVHSMEHGYVVVWYRPDLRPADVARLETVASKYPRDILLVPRPSLPTRVAATAWHHRLLCGTPDTGAIDLFTSTYRNHGPEKVPH